MFQQSRPRFWIAGYDTAHLAVPVLLVAVILALAFAPPPPPRVAPQPARPMVVPQIVSPAPGTILAAGQAFSLDGVAEPGSNVRLFYFLNQIDYPLGDTRAGADGRWRFTVNGLQSGNHSFRATAFLAGRSQISREVTYQVKAPPRTAPTRPQRRR